MREVQKLDMAVEQLEDALSAYFAERYHSAAVLAGAAEQLFAGYLHKHGIEPSWSHMRRITTRIANAIYEKRTGKPGTRTEKDIGDLLNRAYNHSKHAGSSDHKLWMDPKFEARELIDRCISNFDRLFTHPDYELRDLPMIQRFLHESINGVQLEKDTAEVLSAVDDAE